VPIAPPQERPLRATGRFAAERRAARGARWEHARALRAEGASIQGVARALGIDRRTARGLIASPVPPRNRTLRPRPEPFASPTLAVFVPYLQDRWQAGCTNVCQLFREIVARGYRGSRTLLSRAVQPWRPPRAPATTPRRRLSVRWLLLRPPGGLDPDERAALQRVLDEDADLAAAHELVQRFRALVAARDAPALDAWLAAARTSGLATFEALANGLAADRAAVDAALTTAWSTGPVEGHVHRLKLIKRRGYGRAKLDLLRARVLAA
jgi:transposase